MLKSGLAIPIGAFFPKHTEPYVLLEEGQAKFFLPGGDSGLSFTALLKTLDNHGIDEKTRQLLHEAVRALIDGGVVKTAEDLPSGALKNMLIPKDSGGLADYPCSDRSALDSLFGPITTVTNHLLLAARKDAGVLKNNATTVERLVPVGVENLLYCLGELPDSCDSDDGSPAPFQVLLLGLDRNEGGPRKVTAIGDPEEIAQGYKYHHFLCGMMLASGSSALAVARPIIERLVDGLANVPDDVIKGEGLHFIAPLATPEAILLINEIFPKASFHVVDLSLKTCDGERVEFSYHKGTARELLDIEDTIGREGLNSWRNALRDRVHVADLNSLYRRGFIDREELEHLLGIGAVTK